MFGTTNFILEKPYSCQVPYFQGKVKYTLRWPKTVSSTFQEVHFDGSWFQGTAQSLADTLVFIS